MFGLLRCGCILLLLLLCLLLGACVAVLWLATRAVGPQYRDGAYIVRTGSGAERIDRISSAAARRFDAKQDVRPDPQTIARLQLLGLDFTEEELNSRLAEQLAERPLDSNGIRIERVFVELHPLRPTVYLYTSTFGVPVTCSSQLTFRVVNNSAKVTVEDPKAGQMPIGAVLPRLLAWSGNTERVEQLLTYALPPQVTAIQPREGSLHIAVNIFKFARASDRRLELRTAGIDLPIPFSAPAPRPSGPFAPRAVGVASR